MTESELAEMLRRNPDLQVDGASQIALDPERRFACELKLDSNIEPSRIQIMAGMSEHDLQAAVIAECDLRSILRVEYGLIFAIPNGQYRQGQRMEPGLRPGVLDLCLPVARQGYHGLYIELKVGKNEPSQKQLEWIRKLRGEGYRCEVIWDSVAAVMAIIEDYLEG